MKHLTERQIEDLSYAMDCIHSVMSEVEGNKKKKKVWTELDKCSGILYEIIAQEVVI